MKRIEKFEETELDNLVMPSCENFQPFILLKEGGNCGTARNRHGSKPQIGNVTSNLSFDYLSALIKDIILELKKKDKDILKKLFKYHRVNSPETMLEILKDRLRHSMRIQKKLEDDDNIYKSTYFKENLVLFDNNDKIYQLDKAVIDQLENRMTAEEKKSLYKWELTGEGIYLVLCEKSDEDNTSGSKVIEYHSSDSKQKFNNQEEKLKLEVDEPSLNRIYGSLKQISYIKNKDIEYIKKSIEDNATEESENKESKNESDEQRIYYLSNTKGVGFEIFSGNTNPTGKMNIDGQEIAKDYQEKDREESSVGSRTKTLRDTYFGENIILRNKKKTYGQLSGDLVYIYGPGKKDQLTIEGFINGDYGINLIEKPQEKNDEEVPVTYLSDLKVKFDPFEYAVLEKLEIKRKINEHTTVYISGYIKDENAAEYIKYMDKPDQELIITYGGDDSNILFKGIITNYELENSAQNNWLELKAASYSILLQRERRYRIYQNLGTTYKDICSKISSENDAFNISCADGSIGGAPLVSEQYPVVLQYRETDWDFIRRIASYLDEPVIVDDTKDNSETVNIQIGCHNSAVRELKNVNGGFCKTTDRRNIKKNVKYRFFRVYYRHKSIDDFYNLGSRVKCFTSYKSEDTVEFYILKDRMYIEKGSLFSEFVLARKEDIQILNARRKYDIAGLGLRAEVKKVNNKHQAKVQFVDIDDDFEESKAYWFPLDRVYTDGYLAPEVGDIIDLYFKSKNEKYATIKGCSNNNNQETDNTPEDKVIETVGGYKLLLNNESILLVGKDEKSVIKIVGDQIEMTTKFSGVDNKLIINKDMIELSTKEAKITLDKNSTVCDSGGSKLELTSTGLNIG